MKTFLSPTAWSFYFAKINREPRRRTASCNKFRDFYSLLESNSWTQYMRGKLELSPLLNGHIIMIIKRFYSLLYVGVSFFFCMFLKVTGCFFAFPFEWKSYHFLWVKTLFYSLMMSWNNGVSDIEWTFWTIRSFLRSLRDNRLQFLFGL